ncbi:MAG: hypothetical protein ABID63_09580 [Pseudomonadota bacterium]
MRSHMITGTRPDLISPTISSLRPIGPSTRENTSGNFTQADQDDIQPPVQPVANDAGFNNYTSDAAPVLDLASFNDTPSGYGQGGEISRQAASAPPRGSIVDIVA